MKKTFKPSNDLLKISQCSWSGGHPKLVIFPLNTSSAYVPGQALTSRLKPQGGGILKIRDLRMRRQLSPAPQLRNVPHPWALPIIKHKMKFIMNQTYVDRRHMNRRVLMPTPQIVGGFLHLQVGISSLPSLRSRHNMPPNFQEGN